MVAVSLLLSGVVTWVLVRNVEIQNAETALARSAASALGFGRPVVATCVRGRGGAACLGGLDFLARVSGADRVLILDPAGGVLFDNRPDPPGAQVKLGSRRTVGVSGVQLASRTAQVDLGGQTYIGLAFGNRGHLVMVAKSESSLTALAITNLVRPMILAGAIALVFGLVVVLLLSRTMARRLSELSSAAEDVGAGNYSRRVAVAGTDEIGVVGEAFNRMAGAVERSRELQREFLANASHELKTPLTSLIGFSQALVDGSLRTDPERQRAATIIHEEAERVLRLSQELLDLARVESGQVSYDIQPVDLAALCREESELHRQRARDRRLSLEFRIADQLPPVAADPDRLHQIVANLLDNAVKYAPRGSTVRIEAAPVGDEVETVVGNPAGAHPPDPERMFDRFYRADRSRSSSTAGVGLGLAICRQLAEAQRGRLWAELSDGSVTLRLRLPRAG